MITKQVNIKVHQSNNNNDNNNEIDESVHFSQVVTRAALLYLLIKITELYGKR